MKQFWEDFKAFIMRGNVVDLAVAVVIGAAFGAVVTAFVKLRRMALSVEGLARKVGDLERRYDKQFKVVFDAIRELMTPSEKPRRSIGFKVEEA